MNVSTRTSYRGGVSIVVVLKLIMAVLSTVVFLVTPLQASEGSYELPRVDRHVITSKFIDQDFVIYVHVPLALKGESERFPVMYMTDVNEKPSTALMDTFHLAGELPRFITVGIGYPLENPIGSYNIRVRDLTPTELSGENKSDVFGTFPYDGVLEIETQKKTGAGPEFLSFIYEQLMPFINKNYNTKPEETTFWGHSLGGLFGLYTLFNRPEVFKNYIIGSPSIWWDDEVILSQARRYIESGKHFEHKVYLAVGAEEEKISSSSRMVSNVYKLDGMLAQAKLPTLKLKREVFPGEKHLSVVHMIKARGLKYIYGPGCSLYTPNSAKLLIPDRCAQ